jgi:NADH:ubiquinone oxidoreductase subunit H
MRRNGVRQIMTLLDYLVPISVGVVAIVLIAGLVNMMRGGNSNTSQKLMRARVFFQFVAIIVIMTAIYFAST